MMQGTQKLTENIAGIVAAYTQAAHEALEVKPGRTLLVAPGAEVAWDDCCEGQLWGRVVNLAPLQSTSQQSARGCFEPFYLLSIELGILRCASVVNNQGKAPRPETLTDEGLRGIADMAALLEAIQCNDRTRTIGRWTPRGPDGGCVGGFWTFDVRVSNCIDCEE